MKWTRAIMRFFFNIFTKMSADDSPVDVLCLSYSQLTDMEWLFTIVYSNPQGFNDFILLAGVVADSNAPPYHESDIFRFHRRDGQEFYVVVDRVARDNHSTPPLPDNGHNEPELVPSRSEAIALALRDTAQMQYSHLHHLQSPHRRHVVLLSFCSALRALLLNI